jgi:glycosyltransferase involved in cell wall biosynthesis/predicted nuclease with TOPRIM domain
MHDQESYLHRYLAGMEDLEGEQEGAEHLTTGVVVYAYPKVYDARSEGQVITSREAIDDHALGRAGDLEPNKWDVAGWYMRLGRERRQAQMRMRDLEGSIAELQAREREGRERDAKRAEALDNWQALRFQLEQRIAEQQQLLQERSARQQRTEASLESVRSELAQVAEEYRDRLAEEVTRRNGLEQALEQLRATLAESEQARRADAADKRASMQEVQAWKARMADSEQSLRAAQERLLELRTELDAAVTRGEALDAERERGDRLQARSDELRASNDELRASNEALRDRVARLDGNRVDLEKKLSRADADLKQTRGRVDELEQRVHGLEHSHSWRITRPLRALSGGVRRAGGQLRKGRGILAREGALALAGRAYGKIAGRPVLSLILVVEESDRAGLSESLESVRRWSTACRQELLLVDNGAGIDPDRLPSGLPGLRLIGHRQALSPMQAREQAARRARGGWLVFLQPGTRLEMHCLGRLLQTFWERPDTGLVGAKLVHPDGRLASAGAAVWRDGRLSAIGERYRADRPEYSYVRDTDWCLPACFAVDRKWFRRVKGFSAGYAEYAYRVADLCLKLARRGARVVYQPAATAVVHGPFPALPGPGCADRSLFAERWRSELQAYPPADPHSCSIYAMQQGRVKRVLVVDYVMVTPDQDSGSLRMSELLELFAQLGYRITFVASNLEFRPPYGEQLQQRGIEVLYAPFVYSIPKFLEENGRWFDIVLLSRADIAHWFLKPARRHAPNALLVFDTVDLHFLREQRMAELEECGERAKEAEARMRQELDLVAKADVTLVVSPVERELVLRHRPEARVEVLSNIHRIYGSAKAFTDREGLLFIGGFNHTPNVDAVLFFVREVLPLVRRRLEGVRLTVVGSRPPPEVEELAHREDVEVTGYVPDVSGLFARTRLSVAPLRYGAGVKGKVNMSMAYGVPVVATTMAMEGMYLQDGRDVLVADGAEAFAEAVVRLYTDRALWERLSRNGLSNLEQHFSRRAARAALERVIAVREQGR